MSKLIGWFVCRWKGHHIDGHKRRASEVEKVYILAGYVYQCSRCGRLSVAPNPVKRVKK